MSRRSSSPSTDEIVGAFIDAAREQQTAGDAGTSSMSTVQGTSEIDTKAAIKPMSKQSSSLSKADDLGRSVSVKQVKVVSCASSEFSNKHEYANMVLEEALPFATLHDIRARVLTDLELAGNEFAVQLHHPNICELAILPRDLELGSLCRHRDDSSTPVIYAHIKPKESGTNTPLSHAKATPGGDRTLLRGFEVENATINEGEEPVVATRAPERAGEDGLDDGDEIVVAPRSTRRAVEEDFDGDEIVVAPGTAKRGRALQDQLDEDYVEEVVQAADGKPKRKKNKGSRH